MIHLRRSGFKGRDLMSLFNVFIRPVIEYCSLIYHPLLTVGQNREIERMQRQMVKLAYGYNKSYEVICEQMGISTLEERRKTYIDNFVIKTLYNARFSGAWFPRREAGHMDLRARRNYVETKSRTTRYYNSPLSYMRRRANELELAGAR